MSGIERIYATCEATWPPLSTERIGPWSVRNGAGGGKRVSATTAEGAWDEADIAAAEAAMRALGQPELFMIRAGEAALDAALEARGYTVIDPVTAYAMPAQEMAAGEIPTVCAFTVWEPLAMMRDIWDEGGIGPARREVMARVRGPKTGLFGRLNDSPACAGFVAVHGDQAMVHALYVLPHQRGQGMAHYAMRRAARWAVEQGAAEITVLCTKENDAANRLYQGMGMTPVGAYHYRIRED